MALPTLASVDLVESLLGRKLTVDETIAASELLVLASALVRARAREDWVDEDPPDGIAQVAAGAVVRALQNPTGATQSTTGPFSVSYGSSAAERVYLTPADRAIIDGTSSDSSAFSIDPTPNHDTRVYLSADAEGVDSDGWVTVEP